MSVSALGLSPAIIERFWARVAICEHGRTCEQCCWPWKAGSTGRGYGTFSFYDKTLDAPAAQKARTVRASRFALELALHAPLPDGVWALHACDNPPCCNTNPGHLYAGSPSQNMQDMLRAGRHASQRSPRPPRPVSPKAGTKIPNAQIALIHRLAHDGFSAYAISLLLGWHTPHIQAIIDHKIRTDIPATPIAYTRFLAMIREALVSHENTA